jgi:hypothetical protein
MTEVAVERQGGFERDERKKNGQHGYAHDERPALSDAGFDDEVRFDLPDKFLYDHHVLGILNYWLLPAATEVDPSVKIVMN